MNIVLKSAISGALVLAAASANALGVPALNSSDLVLIVQDQTTQATYELDTGISLSSLMGSGYVSGATLNATTFAGINKTIANSSALQTFLNTTDSYGWALEGAQFNSGSSTGTATGNNVKTAGQGIGVFSSLLGTTTPSNVGNTQMTLLLGFLNGLQSDVQFGGGLAPLTGTETTAGSYSVAAASKYGLFGANDLEALGATDQIFGLTGNNVKSGQVQSYLLGTASFTKAGGLVFAANPGGAPVPLPAAAWLFGSGLLGLVGVSRRRKAAV
jgi:hypothetical protein